MIIALLIAGMLFSGLAEEVQASEDMKFPFTGIISADNVNIRAGASTNFEILCQLNKAEKVGVIGKVYRWYKIRLPGQATSFISKDYVYLSPAHRSGLSQSGKKARGTITGDNVNIRAGRGTNYSILGQLHSGDVVTILKEDEGWFLIEPPENFVGWVYDDFIKYGFPQQPSRKEIVSSQQATAEKKIKKEKPQPKPKKRQEKLEKPQPKPKKRQEKKSVSKKVTSSPTVAVGVIEDLGMIMNRPGRQKLRADGGKIFYLKSKSVNLAQYVYYRVRLWGKLEKLPGLKHPLITVERVEVVE